VSDVRILPFVELSQSRGRISTGTDDLLNYSASDRDLTPLTAEFSHECSSQDDNQKDNLNDNRLRQDEAVIYIGETPPGCSYFSYRSYLHHRFFPEEEKYKRIFCGSGLGNWEI